MYLPIAPEIEDPEENWVPGVDPPPDEESPLGTSKRSSNVNNDFKENTNYLRGEHWSWRCLVIFPFHSLRPLFHPNIYSFEAGISSRKKFQQRFLMGLGIYSYHT